MLKAGRVDFGAHPDWCPCGKPVVVKVEAFMADAAPGHRYQRVGMCERCATKVQRELGVVLKGIREERVLGMGRTAALEVARSG